MCKVCGCGDGEVRIENVAPGHHAHDAHHAHDHHGHDMIGHSHSHDMHFGHGPAGAHVGGVSQSHLVQIEQNILAKNDGFAAANRHRLEHSGVLALNLISSPGAGKTTLLVETLNRLKADFAVQVIEGDQESANDAERIRATGVQAVQINTGRGCHLDAHMVGHAMDQLEPARGAMLFIENIGNLVCPAGFDLGEACKVVILSVTEGDDKPIKYPDAFAAADLMLVSKMDLLPHVDFDVAACIEHARCVNPAIEVFGLSAKTGEGMDDWLSWIEGRRGEAVEACAACATDAVAPEPGRGAEAQHHA
jgi:hydrogenase nickel incorporation protein HypB